VGGSTPVVGVLALQGDVREHRLILESLGATVVEVRQASQLEGLSGLVLPGGESSVMDKLMRLFGLREPLKALIARGIPVLATCAGMILVAAELEDGIEGQQTLGGLDITVQRNAFGSQRESFDVALAITGWDRPVDVSFIRAPVVTRVGEGVSVLASLPDQRVVAVENDTITALAFHPEVTGETRFHADFLNRVAKFASAQG